MTGRLRGDAEVRGSLGQRHDSAFYPEERSGGVWFCCVSR
jgi:hypothetical protein